MGGGAAGVSGLVKRSVCLAGHRTSVALEPEFWTALAGVAARRGGTLAGLIAIIDSERDLGRSLASALRIFAISSQD